MTCPPSLVKDNETFSGFCSPHPPLSVAGMGVWGKGPASAPVERYSGNTQCTVWNKQTRYGILGLWRAEDMPIKKSDSPPTIDAAKTVPDPSTLNESDDFRVPWLRLADFLLSPTPTANDIAVIEALARKEQEAIKRRIRRTAEQVKRQSKSKQ